MTADPDVGRRLREAREDLGLSQQFVAERVLLHRSALSDIERGVRGVSTTEMKLLAEVLGRPLATFLDDHASDPPDSATLQLLTRTANQLTEDDRAEVLRFAQFLRTRR